jgi:hypothetical protein
MSRNDMYADWAAAYVAAPTTYKLAPLNSGTNKIDATYLPTSGDTPKGEWNANTNSPALADGSGTAGDYYDVTTAGSQDLGSGSIAYTVGDVVKYNGSTWYKIDSVANILDGSATAADGRSTLSVNSIDEDAQANGTKVTAPAMYFNGTSSVVTVADDDKLSFTDGVDDLPFSIGFKCKVDFSASGTNVMFGKYGLSAATREWWFYYTSSLLYFSIVDSSGRESFAGWDVSSISGKTAHILLTFDGAGPNSSNAFTSAADGMSLYVNGVLQTPQTTYNDPSYNGMVNTSQALWFGKSSSSFGVGHYSAFVFYNMSLSASQATVAKDGDLGFADEWGGTEVYTGDSSTFTSSLGNWSEEGSTAITVAQSGGEMVVTNTAATTGTRGARNTTDTLTEGKRYRISWTSRASSGTGQRLTLTVFNSSPLAAISKLAGSGTSGSVGSATVYTFTPTGSAERHSLELVLAGGGSDSLYFNLANTGAGEVYNFDDITLTQIGTLADFRAEDYNESASKLLDRSSNNFVGVGTSVTLTGNQRHISADTIDLKNLPTSSAGLSAGEVWSNGGVLTVV